RSTLLQVCSTRRSKGQTSLLSTCLAPCFRPAPTGCEIFAHFVSVRAKLPLLCTISLFRIRVNKTPIGGTYPMLRTAFVITLLVSMCSASRAIAENLPTWSPNRPVRIVVPFQAGGPIDAIARIVAQQLNEKWGQSFIIENRTGGGGNIGMELVAKAPADGYTLGTASGGTHGSNATLYGSKLP